MIFGSDKGITKYDVNFKKVSLIETKDKVQCLLNINKVSFLIGQSKGYIQLVNKYLSIQCRAKLRNEEVSEIFEIMKTFRDYEYAISTDKGVYLILLFQETFNQFEI